MNYNTITIGTCVATDILKNCRNELSQMGINISHHLQCTYHLDYKISSIIVPPGLIAERLYNEMHSTIDSQPAHIKRQYNAIVKPMSMLNLVDRIQKENAIVMLDFHGEFYRTFDNGTEYFGIIPNFESFAHHFPDWLLPIVQKNQLSVSDMKPKDQGRRYELITDVVRKLDRSANGRVVMFDNVFTTNVFDKSTNTVGKLISPPLIRRFQLLAVNDNFTENIVDLSLFDRLYSNLFARIHAYYPEWKKISVDRNKCMTDPDHPWGWHPCHLHENCFGEFKGPLLEAIAELIDRPQSLITLVC